MISSHIGDSLYPLHINSVSINGSMVEHVETGEDEDEIDSEDEEN